MNCPPWPWSAHSSPSSPSCQNGVLHFVSNEPDPKAPVIDTSEVLFTLTGAFEPHPDLMTGLGEVGTHRALNTLEPLARDHHQAANAIACLGPLESRQNDRLTHHSVRHRRHRIRCQVQGPLPDNTKALTQRRLATKTGSAASVIWAVKSFGVCDEDVPCHRRGNET